MSSALLLTVAATGVTLYYTGKNDVTEENQQEEMQLAQDETLTDEVQDEEFDMEDVTSNSTIAEHTDQIAEQADTVQEEIEHAQVITEEDEEVVEETVNDAEEQSVEETADTAVEITEPLNFTEESAMVWPVSGEILIDYSMDSTVYFSTLDQYKCNSAVVLESAVGEPVQAAATGKVVSITQNEETGTTVTMDLGNGYQAVYGQLTNLMINEGQTVEEGVILGYIEEPTKYYVKEGANLYFAMTKDGEPVDPMIFLETVTE